MFKNLIKKETTVEKKYFIKKITVNYNRISKIKTNHEVLQNENITWEYKEKLIIDRETEIMKHIQNIGEGCIITKEYYVQQGIRSLIEDIEDDVQFNLVEGNPKNVINDPNETKDYIIKVEFYEKEDFILRGTYDKKGLPNDWNIFIYKILYFMKFYGIGEIFDSDIYGHIKRCYDDYIYISVIFDDFGKSYYYLTDDDSIKQEDFILVPTGYDDHIQIAKVVEKEYFKEYEVPYPIHQTKHVIRKLTAEEIEEIF